MTQEDKELLLKDLCSRLPYGVKCQFEDTVRITDGESNPFYDYVLSARHLDLFINHKNFYIKPYLRPMSSITEEEKSVLSLCNAFIEPRSIELKLDFYNMHHLDFRGLIPKGLAIAITEQNNPYKN